MGFKRWSELNPQAKKELNPDLDFRNWDSLSEDEKYKIWKYLESYFFDKDIKEELLPDAFGNKSYFYDFHNYNAKNRILYSIKSLNDLFKVNSYGKYFLEHPDLNSACADFYDIFIHQKENVVLEMLSLYCKYLISESSNKTISRKETGSNEEYQKKLEKYQWQYFDLFSKNINEIFTAFGINLFLTRQGFIPRQDKKIIKEIYEPVLRCLSHPKWEEVDNLLSDSFNEYRKHTKQGYSNCITNTVCSIQAFLQILVYGKTGKGDISKLIPEAHKKQLISNDIFTKVIFRNMESIFARYRQEKGKDHPPKEYASEEDAQLILNLTMIFFQHCIQR